MTSRWRSPRARTSSPGTTRPTGGWPTTVRPDPAHLGAYIYEGGAGSSGVRQHLGSEIVSLADYRRRYAQYKSNPISRRPTPSRPGWWSRTTTRSTTPTRVGDDRHRTGLHLDHLGRLVNGPGDDSCDDSRGLIARASAGAGS
ncbi:alkaline phosphatase D family protein [Dactylosporangium roseum]|uniref:alkaline phosphatase D family protein n=1 Tax=Dactylosporangium roseum TaxID=47989 RepID=UPI0028C4D5D6|nr:alkaline phosphatase D family protein [Dactylosporangium roseum]